MCVWEKEGLASLPSADRRGLFSHMAEVRQMVRNLLEGLPPSSLWLPVRSPYGSHITLLPHTFL